MKSLRVTIQTIGTDEYSLMAGTVGTRWLTFVSVEGIL